MPLTAGILEIIRGLIYLIALFAIVGFFLAAPSAGWSSGETIFLGISIPPVAILAILSFTGGIYAIKRKRWGLALTGAIAAALPFALMGIASLVLIIMSRKEFP